MILRPRLRTLVLAPLLIAVAAAAAKKEAPPLADINTYPMRETHDAEKVTIAAQPFDTRGGADFFRIDYVGHSILPVRVVIRNDSDHPIDLKDVRIQLDPAHGGKLPAALPEEIHRRVFHVKDPSHTAKLPFPVPNLRTPVDKKIVQDDEDFSLRQTTVAPHSTLAGFLFYDIDDVDDDPPLKGAELYIKMAKFGDTRTELFPFTLSFDKYLTAKPKPSAAPAAK